MPLHSFLKCIKFAVKSNILPLMLASSIPYDISAILGGKKENKNANKDLDKINRYWTNRPISEIVDEADQMFEQGLYLHVYDLLNKMKYSGCPDVEWRISRCLFKLSKEGGVTEDIRDEMIREAYVLITNALAAESGNFNIHKWMAILLDAKSGLEGTEYRVRASFVIKEHMLKAYELNPNDVVILYMLGKWCFEMSRLTFFQKMIAKLLYATLPQTSYSEAYFYFKKAFDLENRFYYIPNVYLLGKTCYHLGQNYRAIFYLKLATQLPARTDFERFCTEKAKCMVEQLIQYDLSSETVLFEFPFDK